MSSVGYLLALWPLFAFALLVVGVIISEIRQGARQFDFRTVLIGTAFIAVVLWFVVSLSRK